MAKPWDKKNWDAKQKRRRFGSGKTVLVKKEKENEIRGAHCEGMQCKRCRGFESGNK